MRGKPSPKRSDEKSSNSFPTQLLRRTCKSLQAEFRHFAESLRYVVSRSSFRPLNYVASCRRYDRFLPYDSAIWPLQSPPYFHFHVVPENELIHPKKSYGEQVVRSEEHTSELQSRFGISYAVFC